MEDEQIVEMLLYYLDRADGLIIYNNAMVRQSLWLAVSDIHWSADLQRPEPESQPSHRLTDYIRKGGSWCCDRVQAIVCYFISKVHI